MRTRLDMRATILALTLAVLALAVLDPLGMRDARTDHAAEQDPIATAPRDESGASIVFLGHAYPLNGHDKREYDRYFGWMPGTEPQETRHGFSIRERLANNSSVERLRREFYDPLADLKPDRLVWGGDSLYTRNADSAAYLLDFVRSYARVPQVYLPGNHDWTVLEKPVAPPLFVRAPGEEESLAGVRVLYLNTVSEDGALMAPGKAYSAPSEAWLQRFHAQLDTDRGEQGLLILLHHAPWFVGRSQANVSHKDSRWWIAVHKNLKSRAKRGQEVFVLSGDGGDHCMADGRIIDGVHYCVTGQPRYDSEIPNGFLRLSWQERAAGMQVDVLTWTPEQGLVEHLAPVFPWRY